MRFIIRSRASNPPFRFSLRRFSSTTTDGWPCAPYRFVISAPKDESPSMSSQPYVKRNSPVSSTVTNENPNASALRDQVSPPHGPHPTSLSIPSFPTSPWSMAPIDSSSEGSVINHERRCTSFFQHPVTTAD